jgi:hypothetical protein
MSKIQEMRGLKARRHARRTRTMSGHADQMPTSTSLHASQNFIQEVRACANKESEAKRVDQELAKIRKRFGSESELTGGGGGSGTSRSAATSHPLNSPCAPARSLRQAQVRVEAPLYPHAGLQNRLRAQAGMRPDSQAQVRVHAACTHGLWMQHAGLRPCERSSLADTRTSRSGTWPAPSC